MVGYRAGREEAAAAAAEAAAEADVVDDPDDADDAGDDDDAYDVPLADSSSYALAAELNDLHCRRADTPEAGRGAAAAATWIFRRVAATLRVPRG